MIRQHQDLAIPEAEMMLDLVTIFSVCRVDCVDHNLPFNRIKSFHRFDVSSWWLLESRFAQLDSLPDESGVYLF
jgi:hypothetical protein